MPRWVILSIFVGVLLWNAQWRQTLGHWLMLSWVLVGALSLLWTVNPVEGTWNLWLLVLLGAFFCIGSSASDLRRFYLWSAFGILPSSLLVLGDLLGFYSQVGASTFPGLFINRTFLGEAAVLVLLANAMSRQWAGVLCALPALVIAQNRASWLALIVVAGVLLCARKRYFSAVALASVIPAMGLIQGGTSSLGFRLEIWKTALLNSEWLGHGLGSFYTLFPSLGSAYAVLSDRPEHPHNELVGAIFELGIFSAIPIALGFWLLSRPHMATEKLVLIAAAVLCLFTFPLHMPFTLLFIAVVAGRCAVLRGMARPQSSHRGSPLLPRMVHGEA